METDEHYMRLALAEADEAARASDVPVGAVVVDRSGEVIGRGKNRREVDKDPTGHAEIVALREAASRLGTWRLHGATLFATLEPCPMCAGALVNSRVERVVYGCDDPKAGALRSLYRLGEDVRLNHRFTVEAGVLADECARTLSAFFAALRSRS
ncbi:MAG TPA: tRNA adenosine(34) deaminase TadA [Polyangiaceae bacterium]|nr:tRNA adenosine(34) deaminase TadA [Polyangiaceae bacterium]